MKEVAEQITKRIAGWHPSHYPSVHLPPSGIDYSQTFTPTENVDSPFQPMRPAEVNPWEHMPSISTALSDTRSVTHDSTSRSKTAEKFEFEPCPQASKICSWKVSFRREDTTGSIHFRLISEWLAEIDLATAMEDLDHSGFMFDKHQLEFETGMLKIIPTELLGGDPIPKQTSNAYGQASYLSYFCSPTSI